MPVDNGSSFNPSRDVLSRLLMWVKASDRRSSTTLMHLTCHHRLLDAGSFRPATPLRAASPFCAHSVSHRVNRVAERATRYSSGMTPNPTGSTDLATWLRALSNSWRFSQEQSGALSAGKHPGRYSAYIAGSTCLS